MRTPQQAMQDAIDSGAVQAWIDGKKIEWQHSQGGSWNRVDPSWRGHFADPRFCWRAAPPDPPKPTVVDWQPIETCPTDRWVLIAYGSGTVAATYLPPMSHGPTHWAPLPAPPQGDK